jgi:undecaprenyl-diphosphatase
VRASLGQLARPPSHSRRAEAARRQARLGLLIVAMLGIAIVALMYGLDAWEIGLMPPRGTASLWPVRILTDFGKDSYILELLAATLIVVAMVAAGARKTTRMRWLSLGTRLQYLFLAVLFPVLIATIVKWTAGRGRPFVGGQANAFNFAPFTGTEPYFSFPSAHAVTAFAFAFAVSAIWPRVRWIMIVYAIVIALTRLVLLAHHPSDVVAGAMIGIVGAMAVRYWFAARRLGFAIRSDGDIVPLTTRRFRLAKEGPNGTAESVGSFKR